MHSALESFINWSNNMSNSLSSFVRKCNCSNGRECLFCGAKRIVASPRDGRTVDREIIARGERHGEPEALIHSAFDRIRRLAVSMREAYLCSERAKVASKVAAISLIASGIKPAKLSGGDVEPLGRSMAKLESALDGLKLDRPESFRDVTRAARNALDSLNCGI
jgi:hypothetical protein